jgi:Tol biopolymer transport system component
MTTHDDFDGRLTAWLDALAAAREPDPLLERVLARTATTRRRPAWAIPERWIPMTSITTPTTAIGRFPWRSAALVAALVAILAGAILVAGSQRPTLPPAFGPAANGALVYSEGGSILGVDTPGGVPRTLISRSGEDMLPWFANDGTRFSFFQGDPATTEPELWVANADGTHAYKLADVGRNAWLDWAPDGSALAVASEADVSGIAIVAADGSGTTTLETGLQRVERPIFRPPEGATITFRGTANGTDWGLYQIGRDGSGLVPLVLDQGFTDDEYYSQNFAYYFLEHTWDPSGRRLLFHTLEPAPGAPAGPGWRLHLAEVDADGTVTAERTIEFDPEMDDEFTGVFLPDGERFTYLSLEGTESRLWLASTAGDAAPRDLGIVTTEWGMLNKPSPDGTQVLTSRPGPGGEEEVVSVDLASGTVAPLGIRGDVTWQRKAP